MVEWALGAGSGGTRASLAKDKHHSVGGPACQLTGLTVRLHKLNPSSLGGNWPAPFLARVRAKQYVLAAHFFSATPELLGFARMKY